jgi:hypothetical protein
MGGMAGLRGRFGGGGPVSAMAIGSAMPPPIDDDDRKASSTRMYCHPSIHHPFCLRATILYYSVGLAMLCRYNGGWCTKWWQETWYVYTHLYSNDEHYSVSMYLSILMIAVH